MKTCEIDGDLYLLTIPTLEQVNRFPDNGLDQFRKDGFFFQEILSYDADGMITVSIYSKQGNPHIQGRYKKSNLESLSERTTRCWLRPMLIPLDSNGFYLPNAQGDCPNGSITTGGTILVNGGRCKANQRKKLLTTDIFTIGDSTGEEGMDCTWMWWDNRLISCRCIMTATPKFLQANEMMDDIL